MIVYHRSGQIEAWHHDGLDAPSGSYPGATRTVVPDSVQFVESGSVLGGLELPPEYLAPSARDVQLERERRLAAGFDYDFGDARGVHRIATTAADMAGWDEVTKIAQAAINIGQPNTTIDVVTDTGPATITALEWQSVLIAAGQFRQPIWAGSFALQAMDPIPADFASNDSYWQA